VSHKQSPIGLAHRDDTDDSASGDERQHESHDHDCPV
jgi:hypothetical protein